jgi:DNA-binding Xre family transcriptional regulator
MYLKDAVAIRIQELCSERNITIHALSLMTDVSYSTLYNAATKKTTAIRMHTIECVCDGLGISIAEFFHSDCFSQQLDL